MPSSVSRHASFACAPRTAQEVSRRLIEIYGEDPAPLPHVTHVVAAARAVDGFLHVLRIGPHAPKSELDFFLLQAVRARVDAIITTAENLRAEPELIHDFAGESRDALAAYRRDIAHKNGPLAVFVLTQSGDLPREHPVWSDAAHKHVLVPPVSAARVAERVPSQVMVHEVDHLDLRAAVAFARARGHGAVSIEAGPTLACTAYGEQTIVDELCLSLYLGGDVAPLALGGALPSDDVLLGDRALCASPCVHEGWSFQRYL